MICGSQLKWWSHFVFSHSSGHFLFPSLPLVWTSDQAITTRMYWNRIFLLLSKHSFCWLDISESLKSCLNNFKWWRLLNDHDDVEGEEGAAILVQHRLLLHRLPWASLMADDDVNDADDDDVDDVEAEEGRYPGPGSSYTDRPGPLWWLMPDSRLHSQRQRAPPPPQFYSTLC